MKALIWNLLICVVLALIFTVLGVYDSDNMAWPIRMIFWTVIMCIGGLVIFFVEPFVFGKLLRNHHPALQVIVIATIISIPITVFLVGLNTRFEFRWALKNWALQYAGVMLISWIIVAGRYLISQLYAFNRKTDPAVEQSVDCTQKFSERLPVKFRSSKLYAVSSEGHYLRVHTETGSTLILMRISDAVKELDNADGLQVHRSWWVAREGISETKKAKGRRLLVLKNGETAPVSRSFLPALKAANLDT